MINRSKAQIAEYQYQKLLHQEREQYEIYKKQVAETNKFKKLLKKEFNNSFTEYITKNFPNIKTETAILLGKDYKDNWLADSILMHINTNSYYVWYMPTSEYKKHTIDFNVYESIIDAQNFIKNTNWFVIDLIHKTSSIPFTTTETKLI